MEKLTKWALAGQVWCNANQSYDVMFFNWLWLSCQTPDVWHEHKTLYFLNVSLCVCKHSQETAVKWRARPLVRLRARDHIQHLPLNYALYTTNQNVTFAVWQAQGGPCCCLTRYISAWVNNNICGHRNATNTKGVNCGSGKLLKGIVQQKKETF